MDPSNPEYRQALVYMYGRTGLPVHRRACGGTSACDLLFVPNTCRLLLRVHGGDLIPAAADKSTRRLTTTVSQPPCLSVVPSGRIAIRAASGFLRRYPLRIYHSVAVFVITAALSAVIIPLKSCADIYAVFLGLPYCQEPFERLKAAP